MTDPAFDVESSRAYWTTVAQVAGVFAVPLVLEARRTVARWKATKRWVRRAQSLFYVTAAFIIIQTVNVALARIHDPVDDETGFLWTLAGMHILAFGLVYIPVAQYFISANADLGVIIRRAMPWSKWRAGRRAYRRERERFNAAMLTVEANYEALDQMVSETRALLRRSIAQDALVASALKEFDLRQIPAGMVPGDLLQSHQELQALSAESDVAETRKLLRKAKKMRKSLGVTMVQGVKFAEQFERESELERITYLSPDFLEQFEDQVGAISDDARDVFDTPKTQDFQKTAMDAQAETDKNADDLKRLRP